MDDLGVIDRFTDTFARYIDTGFGLLSGEVAFLSTVLIAIDVTLAGLLWTLGGEDNILARFLKKVLYVGAFAYIIGNFNALASILFRSFAGLGLEASGGLLSEGEFLRPGRLAEVGLRAGQPILDYLSSLLGFTSFFVNFLEIAILLLAWLVVILAFFILAVQLFIAILEFKLTTLAGFVLVPFALWRQTAFLAERVLGHVVSAGIKILVLAVIVGIGTTLFDEFTTAMEGGDPTLEGALALVLASLALLGLGIFGPGIASGLVSGAPQLAAGSAVGTVGAAAGAGLAGGAAAAGGARLATSGAGSAVRAGSALASGTTSAYRLGAASSGATGPAAVGAGLAGIARAGAGAVAGGARSLTAGARGGAEHGEQAARTATGGGDPASPDRSPTPRFKPAGNLAAPSWSQRLRQAGASAALHSLRDADRPGSGAAPRLADDER